MQEVSGSIPLGSTNEPDRRERWRTGIAGTTGPGSKLGWRGVVAER